VADLKSAKPEHWEPILQVYRGMARRQQIDENAVPEEIPMSRHAPVQPARTSVPSADAVSLAARQDVPSPSDKPLPAVPELPSETSPGPPENLATSDEGASQAATDGTTGGSGSPEKGTSVTQTAFRAEAQPMPELPESTSSPETAADAQTVSAHAQIVPRSGEVVGWTELVGDAAGLLEQQLVGPAQNENDVREHAVLRLMYLLLDRPEDALRPIDGISAAQQDFWTAEMYGLAEYLDHEGNPDAERRAAAARHHLLQATSKLGELSALRVRNLAFCDRVTSYGIYNQFETNEFEAQQRVLLYAEVENFKSKETDEGYVTSLRSSYEIFDSRNQRIAEHDFSTTEETCLNPRRDFFMRYFVTLPKEIYSGGRYTLKLTIEDTIGHKIGQADIEFHGK